MIAIYCLGGAIVGFLMPEFLFLFSRNPAKIPFSMNILSGIAGAIITHMIIS
jgi:hypothetical protein